MPSIFTAVPLNLYLTKNVEDIVVFLGLKVLNSDDSYMFSWSSHFCKEIKIEKIQNSKQEYLNNIRSNKTLKVPLWIKHCIFAWRSLEITRTVPLSLVLIYCRWGVWWEECLYWPGRTGGWVDLHRSSS